MYSMKEVTDITNISRKTLYHYERLGLLIPIKRGNNSCRYN
jgi:Predicted transcriptional regulators